MLHRRGDQFNGVVIISPVMIIDHVTVSSCASVQSTSLEHGMSYRTVVTTLDKPLSSVLVIIGYFKYSSFGGKGDQVRSEIKLTNISLEIWRWLIVDG